MAKQDEAKPATTTHMVAQFTGSPGTRRIITKKDQDRLIGVDGVAEKDLIWEPGGNTKVDVTNVHEDVLEYLKQDSRFKLKEVEAPKQ